MTHRLLRETAIDKEGMTMCNERENQASEARKDWLASAAWALLGVAGLGLSAALAFLGDLPHRHAWIGFPFAFPALLIFMALAWALPWRWLDWLAEALPEGLQLGLMVAACAAAWWLILTLLAYPVCRARRINRSMARILEGAP